MGCWNRLPSGNLALESSLVTFDCSLCEDIQVETHSIFIGCVEEVIVRAKSTPLVYINGQYAHVIPRGNF